MDSHCDRCHEEPDIYLKLCPDCRELLCEICWGNRANESCGRCIRLRSLRNMSDHPKLECEMPTEADLDYMCATLQRHTEGFDEWWQEFTSHASGREVIAAIISVWEAGRMKAHTNPRGDKNGLHS